MLTRRAHLLTVLVAAIAAVIAPTNTNASPTNTPDQLSPAAQALLEAANLELPAQPPLDIPPPTTLDPNIASPEPLTGRARFTLDEALEDLRSNQPNTAAGAEHTAQQNDAAPGDQLAALRLYARARLAAMEGRLTIARDALRQAVNLDPDASPVWRELALVERALDNVPAATAAFERAYHADNADPLVIENLASAALQRDNPARAADLLDQLANAHAPALDPAVPALARFLLADALQTLGYHRAAAQSLAAAIQAPEHILASTDRRDQFAALLRARATAHQRIGDTMLALGDLQSAAQSYKNALQLDQSHRAPIPRLIYTQLRLAQPYTAARSLILELPLPALSDPRIPDLLRYYAQHTKADLRVVRNALDERLNDHPLPSVRASLRAALAPTERAAEILLEAFENHPDDPAIRRALLDHIVHAQTQSGPERLARIARADPIRLRDLAIDLHHTLHSKPALRDTLREALLQHEPTLAVWLRFLAGEPAQAAEQAAKLAADAPSVTNWHTAGWMAARLAHSDTLQQAFDALAELARDDPDAAIALAQLQRLDSRIYAARTTLQTLIDRDRPPPTRLADALAMRADIARELGRHELAVDLLRRAIAIAPHRENTRAALITAVQQSGADASAALAELRALRPGGQTFRTLRIADAARAGQQDLAETELLNLIEEFPHQPELVEALVSIWLAAGRTDHALRWLSEQASRSPTSPLYIMAMTRAFLRAERPEEATGPLLLWLENYKGDHQVSRLAENVLASFSDGRALIAGRLALRRLQSLPDRTDTLADRARAHFLLNDANAAIDNARRAIQLTEPSAPIIGTDRLDLALQGLVRLLAAIASASPPMLETAVDLQIEAVAKLRQIDRETFTAFSNSIVRTFDRDQALIDAASRLELAPGITREELFELILAEFVDQPTANNRRNERILKLAAAAARTLEPQAALPYNVQWMLFARQTDNQQHILQALQVAHERDQLVELILNAYWQENLDPNRQDEQIETVAEVLYLYFGLQFSRERMSDAAHWVYARVLELSPQHADAANSWGYTLLEAQQELPLTAHLIALAYAAAEPDDAHIIDSWGWLLYRAGRIRDTIDDEGNVIQEGAVTVLTRSLNILIANDRTLALPVIRDHLADAQWRAGLHEEAIDNWQQAILDAKAAEGELNVRGANDLIIQENRTAAQNAREKVDAVNNDQPPPLAPLYEGLKVPDPQQVLQQVRERGELQLPPFGGS